MEPITYVYAGSGSKRGGRNRGPVLIKDVKTVLQRSQTKQGSKDVGVGGKGFIDIITRDVARRRRNEGENQ